MRCVAKNQVVSAVAGLLLCAAPELPASSVFERPVPEGGGSTEIRCAIVVLDIDEINDAGQSFTVNVYLRIQWNDPREAHGGKGRIIKGLDEVWYPQLLFVNKQRAWTGMVEDVEITPDGEVVYRQQFWGDFSQPMNLHDYPFDQQVFALQLVEAGPEKAGDLVLVQDPESESSIVENFSVADWKVVHSEVSSEPYVLPNGDHVDAFAFLFTAKRLSNHHLVKIIAPLLMIVILSWVVFWIDPKDGGSQLGVAVTSFLTMIAFHVALNSRLPEISYLTRLDVFVFGATLLVFLSVLEVLLTTGLARTGRVKTARWMDRVCRLLFPGTLALVAIYAYAWH
jgi:hypothetical protein